MRFLELFEKKLTIDYVKKFLRGKGLITDEGDEHFLSFRLCDKTWNVVCDGRKALVRISFGFDEDADLECLMRANNAINNGKWIVKCSYHIEKSEETGKNVGSEVFSYESLINRASDFDEFYEIAVNVLWDTVEEQQKFYHKFLEEKKNGMQKIGFHTETSSEDSPQTTTNKSNRIGFV